MDSALSCSIRAILTAATLLVSGILLFARLGHYPLWDDEAQTCLISRGVARTGDTSAVLGQNIVAYRQGILIRNFKERTSPPLQFFLEAPFVGANGTSAGAARIPCAVLGLATIGLILGWAWRSGCDSITFALLCIAIVGNVSLMLYLRQARYYAPMILLSVAVAYSYWHLQTRRGLVIHAILSVLLLATNYLAYGAWMIAMLVDYLVWGRRRRPIKGIEWLLLLGPQVVLGALILLVFNPLRISTSDPSSPHGWFIDRFILLWRTFRDMDRCEYACTLLILLAIPIAIWKRNGTLIRALAALIIAIVVIDFASPQSPRGVDTADVRYFSSLIPLGIVIGVMTLRNLVGRVGWVALIVAPLAFWTNLCDVSAWTFASPRVTIAKYVHELWRPPPDPYTAAIAWIDQNVKPGESIVALPDYFTYPLMFHEPKALYGWQLNPQQKSLPEYRGLPAIQFINGALPDYFICFGPVAFQVANAHLPYDLVAILDVFCQDRYRPELMWRTFDPIPVDKDHGGAVYIFKKHPEPPPPAPNISDFKL